MCREEAAALSSLQLGGVPLYGVVHETLGADKLNKYFTGDIYLDKEKKFYGPKERRMLITGMLRFNLYYRVYLSKQKGINGNMKGDGSLLGGVFVIGPGDQGILYEHREMDFGDHANLTQVLEAANKIK